MPINYANYKKNMFEMKKIALSVKAVLLLSLPLAANAGVKVVNGTFNPSVCGGGSRLNCWRI